MNSMLIKILLVDDHAMLRDGLRLLLSSEADFEIVGETDDGQAAVRLAEELRPDVVVMDFHLQGSDGVTATRQICDRWPEIKVVGVTGDNSATITTRLLQAGASGYVVKTAAFEELSTAIRTVFRGGTYLSQRALGTLLVSNPAAGLRRPSLSPRELEVLKLVAEGRSTKQAAMQLNVSVKTIETHRRNMMEKLNVDNVADLTRYAIREGISNL